MNEHTFKVVPLCDKQKRDIKDNNILNDGLYRKCDVYKGGGGYDKFPSICEKRLGYNYYNQFVVQLFGCPLKCPYCYVTPDGIFGEYVEINADDMVNAFVDSKLDIFHLMGGAPALYIEDWILIIDKIEKNKVFHSDLLLIEKDYSIDILKNINQANTLYAVSIKGIGYDFEANTGVKFNENLFWNNLNKVIENGLNFYFTFTGLSKESVENFKNECKTKLNNYTEEIFNDSFIIDLVEYEALKD
jgi:Organic radical activating enzymes